MTAQRGDFLNLQLPSVWLEKSVAGCNWMKKKLVSEAKKDGKYLRLRGNVERFFLLYEIN